MASSTGWHVIEAAFHALADLPASAGRDVQLLELCGHDAALAAQVQALLAEDARLREAEPQPARQPGPRGQSRSALAPTRAVRGARP